MSAGRSSEARAKAVTRLSDAGAARLGSLLTALERLDLILTLPEHPAEADAPLPFGRYRLLARLGAGRFGTVLLADEPTLGRRVALKVPQPAVLAEPGLWPRLSREGRAVAALDHAGIVPVFEAGELDGLPYLVVGYVPGPTLDEWLSRHPGPVTCAEAARLIRAAAEAVQHAHERGVLHCDLTPSNVLLQPTDASSPDSLSAYAPAVTDFGLARLTGDDPATTQTFRIAGTPLYMAPEQARGERRNLTARADIYALGAILYQLLTGRPLFRGDSSGEVLRQVLSADPECPRALNPEVSRDLRAVCLKCLEKNPAGRYVSARDLADDLGSYLRGEPVAARRLAPATQAARWAARHPAWVASAIAACGLVVALAIALVDRYAVRVKHEADVSVLRERAEASDFVVTVERVRQRRLGQEPNWPAMNLADLRHLAGSPVAGEHLPLLRSEAAAALAGVDLGIPREVGAGFKAFSPDGKTLALGSWLPDGKGTCAVLLLDPETGAERRRLHYETDSEWERRYADFKGKELTNLDGCRSLTFSPDGRWLVLGTRSGWLLRWDLNRGDFAAVRWRHAPICPDPRDDRVKRLAFTRTGRLLVSSDDERLAAWDAQRGWAEVARPAGGSGTVVLPARPNDPLFIQLGSQLRAVRERRPWVGEPLCDLVGTAPAAGPRGELLFSARFNNTVVPLAPPLNLPGPDADDGTMHTLAPPGDDRTDDGVIENLAVSPDGLHVATGAEQVGHLKLWSTASLRLLSARSLGAGSMRLAFAPDGKSLAVCAEQRTLLFSLPTARVTQIVALQQYPVSDIASDSERVALLVFAPSGAGVIRVVSPDRVGWVEQISDPYQQSWPQHNNSRCVAIDRTSGAVAYTGGPGVTVQSLGVTARIRPAANLRDMAFGPGGRLWIAAGELVGWDGRGPDLRIPVTTGPGDATHPTSLAVSGPLLAAGLSSGHVLLADLRDGRELCRWKPFNQEVASVGLGTDRRIIVGSSLGEVRAIHGETGEVTLSLPAAHHDAVTAVAPGPDGWFATGSRDRTVKIWDPSGHLVMTLPQARPVRRVFWAEDGSSLTILAEGERGLQRWDLTLLNSELAGMGIAPALP